MFIIRNIAKKAVAKVLVLSVSMAMPMPLTGGVSSLNADRKSRSQKGTVASKSGSLTSEVAEAPSSTARRSSLSR